MGIDFSKTFKWNYQEGLATKEDIDLFVDKWHDDELGIISLPEYLGFTWEEYQIWSPTPSTLGKILGEECGY